ncbi:nascent polypeptide-associated complex subunit alpha, muscle-specific form-like [Vombatus ursinus]|uniref:nascent polypeptide-associated complex subunit alpha, muscle-specific form-like n=1 Tax=Vombatus ursinus TaxID=29139 RepID=UPI000FFD778A|nr:nascent polypeptide-associated complex subunit alpha, muscle-specific form-like [Vombatus ursinus]
MAGGAAAAAAAAAPREGARAAAAGLGLRRRSRTLPPAPSHTLAHTHTHSRTGEGGASCIFMSRARKGPAPTPRPTPPHPTPHPRSANGGAAAGSDTHKGSPARGDTGPPGAGGEEAEGPGPRPPASPSPLPPGPLPGGRRAAGAGPGPGEVWGRGPRAARGAHVGRPRLPELHSEAGVGSFVWSAGSRTGEAAGGSAHPPAAQTLGGSAPGFGAAPGGHSRTGEAEGAAAEGAAAGRPVPSRPPSSSPGDTKDGEEVLPVRKLPPPMPPEVLPGSTAPRSRPDPANLSPTWKLGVASGAVACSLLREPGVGSRAPCSRTAPPVHQEGPLGPRGSLTHPPSMPAAPDPASCQPTAGRARALATAGPGRPRTRDQSSLSLSKGILGRHRFWLLIQKNFPLYAEGASCHPQPLPSMESQNLTAGRNAETCSSPPRTEHPRTPPLRGFAPVRAAHSTWGQFPSSDHSPLLTGLRSPRPLQTPTLHSLPVSFFKCPVEIQGPPPPP